MQRLFDVRFQLVIVAYLLDPKWQQSTASSVFYLVDAIGAHQVRVDRCLAIVAHVVIHLVEVQGELFAENLHEEILIVRCHEAIGEDAMSLMNPQAKEFDFVCRHRLVAQAEAFEHARYVTHVERLQAACVRRIDDRERSHVVNLGRCRKVSFLHGLVEIDGCLGQSSVEMLDILVVVELREALREESAEYTAQFVLLIDPVRMGSVDCLIGY